MDIVDLLGPHGDARAHFRESNGEWVDPFFDRVVAELTASRIVDTQLQDITLVYGAKTANVVITPNGDIQLNVRWDDKRGWSCYTAETYELAVANMWSDLSMVEKAKGRTNDT